MSTILKRILLILPFLFVFIASLYLPTDPDLGWHLKYGEYFFQHHQLLRDNTFSTMMPNYHWANGSWGTDIITYAIFKTGGFLGLALASSSIFVLTFFFFARAGKIDFLSQAIFFPLFIYFLSPINSSSFRGQQLSYLFFGILIYLISNYKPLSKKLLFIPLLFLVWCNVHEESFLFLTFFGAWVIYMIGYNILTNKANKRSLQKKENLLLLGTLVLSFLVTFINPFGAELLGNAFSYIGNDLTKYVSEYQPYPIFSTNWWSQIVASILLIVYLINLLVRKKIGKRFPIVILSTVLLLLGFGMRRYLWPAYYVMLSFLSIPSFNLKKYREKYATLAGTIISLLALFIVIQTKLPFTQFTNMSWDKYCNLQSLPCSSASALYLQKHHLVRNIFSYYDWGGWLIWNYPDLKPSIDGRMHIWKDANAHSATEEYNAYVNAQKNIDKSPYDIIYLPNDNSPLALELSTLIQQKKWKVAYTDDRAGIAVRVEKKN